MCLFLTPGIYQKALAGADGVDLCVLVCCKVEVQKYLNFMLLGLERL